MRLTAKIKMEDVDVGILNELNQEYEKKQEVIKAMAVIKDYCLSRCINEETNCIECPIKQVCDSEPYLWEVGI